MSYEYSEDQLIEQATEEVLKELQSNYSILLPKTKAYGNLVIFYCRG